MSIHSTPSASISTVIGTPLARHEAAPPVSALQAEAPSLDDGARHLTRSLMTSLRLRTRALELPDAPPARPAPARPLALARRDARNIVLRAPVASGGALCATLAVDQHHPYFFSQPLEHLPCVLLVAGVLQLAELALARSGMDDMFINTLDGRFLRAAHKDQPVTLTLTCGARTGQFKVRCIQGGELMCEATLGAAVAPACAGTAAPVAPSSAAVAPDNALVGPVVDDGRTVHADTLPVPPDHFHSDEGGEHHSMLYFLEIARQCFALVGPAKLGIAAGAPATLVELRCTLEQPIPRARSLRLLPTWQSGQWTAPLQTGRVRMALMDGAAQLGSASIVAQVLAPVSARAAAPR